MSPPAKPGAYLTELMVQRLTIGIPLVHMIETWNIQFIQRGLPKVRRQQSCRRKPRNQLKDQWEGWFGDVPKEKNTQEASVSQTRKRTQTRPAKRL